MRRCLLLFLVLLFPATAQAAGLDASPPSLTFNQATTAGPSAIGTSVVTNNTGGPVGITVNGPSDPAFTVLNDDPISDCSRQFGLFTGSSCRVRVQFDPSTTASVTDSIVVTGGTDDATISLMGTIPELSPGTGLGFGQQSINAGPTAAQSATFTNSGTGPVTFTGPPVIGGADASQFQVTSNGCTGTLQPGDPPCSVGVAFDPNSFGSKSAQVSVPSNAQAPAAAVSLSGTGIQAQLSRSPDTLSFSQDVNGGPSSPQVATVTNVGSESVPISSVTISDPSQFSQLTGGNDCTSSTTIPAGGACEVRIVFDPATKGPTSASVTVNSTAAPISIALSGSGTLLALDVPSALDLGMLTIGDGTTERRSATVTNSGTDPVTLRSIRLRDPDTARFLWASGLSTDCAAGRTLGAGEACDLRVVYAPQSDGLQTGTMTLDTSAGTKTMLVTAAGTPGLRIPAFSVSRSKIRNRRMTVTVTPLGGTVSNIAVRVRSSSGAIVASGTLVRAASERGVALKLRSTLRPGRYVATASGRDLFAGVVKAPDRKFSVR